MLETQKGGGYCGEHVGTTVVPEESQERTSMLERFLVVLKGLPTPKSVDETEVAPCPHPSTKLRGTRAVGTIAAWATSRGNTPFTVEQLISKK